MPRKPAAEVAIDATVITRLLRQAEGLVATGPLEKAAEGWDCEVWRFGADLAVRLPRRALAAPLIAHEASALPRIAPAIEATGVRVPAPLFVGAPDEGYPWSWSIVPWIEGVSGLAVARRDRAEWASRLAAALAALHVEAPDDHPINPVRGVPLVLRAGAVAERIAQLRAEARVPMERLDAAERSWSEGLDAPAWSGPPVWIHGDLHPGNLLADQDDLAGIVDFGDVTAGDPAYDLAIAWLAFDARGRGAFVAATRARYDGATWVRARAWAASIAVLLALQSDDEPTYGALSAEALVEVSAD